MKSKFSVGLLRGKKHCVFAYVGTTVLCLHREIVMRFDLIRGMVALHNPARVDTTNLSIFAVKHSCVRIFSLFNLNCNVEIILSCKLCFYMEFITRFLLLVRNKKFVINTVRNSKMNEKKFVFYLP